MQSDTKFGGLLPRVLAELYGGKLTADAPSAGTMQQPDVNPQINTTRTYLGFIMSGQTFLQTNLNYLILSVPILLFLKLFMSLASYVIVIIIDLHT